MRLWLTRNSASHARTHAAYATARCCLCTWTLWSRHSCAYDINCRPCVFACEVHVCDNDEDDDDATRARRPPRKRCGPTFTRSLAPALSVFYAATKQPTTLCPAFWRVDVMYGAISLRVRAWLRKLTKWRARLDSIKCAPSTVAIGE